MLVLGLLITVKMNSQDGSGFGDQLWSATAVMLLLAIVSRLPHAQLQLFAGTVAGLLENHGGNNT
jgi:hypothetical protein